MDKTAPRAALSIAARGKRVGTPARLTRSAAQLDAMFAAVVDQRDLRIREGHAVQRQRGRRIDLLDHLDAVQRAAEAVDQAVARPVCRQYGLQAQAAAAALQTEQRLDDQTVHPAGRAGVPAPAAAPGMGGDAIDIGGHHIGLDLVLLDALRGGWSWYT